MQIFYTNILIFIFYVSYTFRSRGFFFRKTFVYRIKVRCSVFYMDQYKQPSTYQTVDNDACKTYHTITAYTTVTLKVNPRDRNM